MWGLDYKESWAEKNWCFWIVVLKTLESPLDCKEIQPVHPKGDQSWCSLEGLMLKLKLQYFGHLTRRADSFERTLMLGKNEGRRGDDGGWDGWMASPTQWSWVCVNSGSWWWTGRPGVLRFMGSQSGMTKWLNWTELNTERKNAPNLRLTDVDWWKGQKLALVSGIMVASLKEMRKFGRERH